MLPKCHWLAATLLAVVVGGCSPTAEYVPKRIVEARLDATPAPRGTLLLRTTTLNTHNAARAVVGVPPLTWSNELAASARGYANTLAQTGRFAHAEQPHGPTREGENLWTGTRGAYGYGEMIAHWVAEREAFINRATPMFSRTGRWQDAVHYAQIVWRGSTQVGCATASNARDDFLVCRYAPTGNVVGQRAY